MFVVFIIGYLEILVLNFINFEIQNLNVCSQIPICWDANQADATVRTEKISRWPLTCVCVARTKAPLFRTGLQV
jgi:hypothetical protein